MKTIIKFFLIAILFTGCTNDKHVGRIIKNAVKDYDGNQYDAVRLGKQVWMKTNLRTTHFADGRELQKVNREFGPNDESYCEPERYWGYWHNIDLDIKEYGLLYNEKSVMDNAGMNETIIQGPCPKGWHIPSVSDYQDLLDYVQAHCEGYNHILVINNTDTSKHHHDDAFWVTTYNKPDENPENVDALSPYLKYGSNQSQFSLIFPGYSVVGDLVSPGGAHYGKTLYLANLYTDAVMWALDKNHQTTGVHISTNLADPVSETSDYNNGFNAIRCVKN